MKIYFAGSIKGGREKQDLYHQLIDYCQNFGTVLTEHVGNIKTDIENELKLSTKEDEHVYLRDTKWIDESDLIIAEVSIPSLGVGYELGYGESKNKPILCLYCLDSEKPLSYMLSGNGYNQIIYYATLEEAQEKLKTYFENNMTNL